MKFWNLGFFDIDIYFGKIMDMEGKNYSKLNN